MFLETSLFERKQKTGVSAIAHGKPETSGLRLV